MKLPYVFSTVKLFGRELVYCGTNKTYIMRILSFFVAVFLFSSSVQAQSKAQIRAGVNLANVSVNNDGNVDDANMLTSFQVGVLGDVHLASILHLQPGISFTGKGSKLEIG